MVPLRAAVRSEICVVGATNSSMVALPGVLILRLATDAARRAQSWIVEATSRDKKTPSAAIPYRF